MAPAAPSREASDSSLNQESQKTSSANKLNNTNGSTTRKDIWTLIKERKEYERKNAPPDEKDVSIESTVMFVGSKTAGKSSLITRFLDKDEPKTQTMALEYTFCRRTRGVHSIKDIAHIWELGSGKLLSELIDCSFHESNIHSTTFVITVDLSEPSEMLDILDHFMEKIHSRAESILSGLEQRGSKRPKALRAFAWKKFGADHPEKDYIKPSVVPIIIVGCKYDLFRDLEPEKRKMICKILRFIAHSNGASLLFTSQKDENSTARASSTLQAQLLNSFAFKTSAPKGASLDHNKPLYIAAGSDSFAQMGHLRSDNTKPDSLNHFNFVPYERWKSDFHQVFPPKTEKKQEKLDVSRYPERVIDALRAQKDDELEKIKRQNERRSKEKDFLIPGAMGNTSDKRKGNAYSRAKAANISEQ